MTMRQVSRVPLRAKLLIAFWFVLLIPLGAVGVYGYDVTRRQLVEQVLLRSKQEVFLQAEHLLTALTQANGDALYLAQSRNLSQLRQAYHSTSETSEHLALWRQNSEEDFAVLLSVRPMYHSLRYLNNNGDEVIYVEASDTGVIRHSSLSNRRTASYFQQTILQQADTVIVSSFLPDNDDDPHARVVHYSMKLGNDGVLLIDIHADWILRNLPRATQGDAWALVDQSGDYLVYPDNSLIGIDGRVSADFSPLLSGGRGAFSASGQVIVYATIYPSNNPDRYWVLYRSSPAHILYAEVNNFYTNSALFLLAGVFLAAAIAMILGERISAPIMRLQRQVTDFGHGGATPQLPERLPNDETGDLVLAFCDMAQELEAKRREERHLIERLISAQEEERKLVAFDLHDGLIQQLVGARLYLNQARQLQRPEDTQSMQYLRHGCDALSEAIVEGRRIIEGLRPGALDDLGLCAALRELAHNTAQAAGWRLNLEVSELPQEPEMSVGVTLYRIAQEALSNARKHASANSISLALHNGNGISLSVQDDGCGFDLAKRARSGGFGITTMRERAELLGGTCQIHSAERQGTQIHIWIPAQPVDRHEVSPEGV